jgi:hypothetical protein
MKIRLLLFDDMPANREQVKHALSNALGAQGEVQEFVSRAGGLTDGTYEVRLKKDLLTAPNASADLIVADRDLSSYKEHFPGLSEDTVRRVAEVIGVPECGYARGERDDDSDYIKRGEEREACIRLSLRPDLDQFARRVVAIANGFVTIAGALKTLEGKRLPPAKLLATILGKPEYADKIALYASGDQNRLATVLRAKGNEEEQRRRLACLLGYWLWDSVLRFPGVTVGTIPASSYLNIKQEVFENDKEVQALFSDARYQGPFAAAKVDMWWRGALDDIVAGGGCRDGRELAAKQLGRDVAPSQCCEDPSIPAGYYCMLRSKPVSLKNSKGGLPWFPRGADLARVSKPALDELGPWL